MLQPRTPSDVICEEDESRAKINLDDMGRIIPFFCLKCGLMLMSGDYCDACKDELKQLNR